MQLNRPVVLSIAGLDPSAGAGLLADIKTFEQYKVYGLGISTAQTIQTEEDFFTIKWEKQDHLLTAIEKMLLHYDVSAIKIGIVEDISTLRQVVSLINSINNKIKIVLDPVIRSGTGFTFIEEKFGNDFYALLSNVFLITPNYDEAIQLWPSSGAKESAMKLAAHCNVLLKGGHNNDEPGVDYLYTNDGIIKLEAITTGAAAKHGSGCVLSSAIAANLALEHDLVTSCTNAKKYTTEFLNSNMSLLGYHHVS